MYVHMHWKFRFSCYAPFKTCYAIRTRETAPYKRRNSPCALMSADALQWLSYIAGRCKRCSSPFNIDLGIILSSVSATKSKSGGLLICFKTSRRLQAACGNTKWNQKIQSKSPDLTEDKSWIILKIKDNTITPGFRERTRTWVMKETPWVIGCLLQRNRSDL